MKNYNLFKIVRVGVIWGVILNMVLGAFGGVESFGISSGGEGTLGVVDETGRPRIYIKAVNPGYTIDKISNVGEMIEIAREEAGSDDLISLAGVTIRYTTSKGKDTDLVTFPSYSYLAGESFLFRLASSPGSELAAGTYTKTLAYEGSLSLWSPSGEMIGRVCWTGDEGCSLKFKSASPTTLVFSDGGYEHVALYTPEYREGDYVILEPEVEVPGESDGSSGGDLGDFGGSREVEIGKGEVGGSGSSEDSGSGSLGSGSSETEGVEASSRAQCRGLVFSEILSYYAESKTEQFIEFYNMGSEQVLMNGCQVKYKNKYYELSGIIKPEEYFAWYMTEFNLTKNPTSTNVLELIDVDGAVVDTLEYPNGQRKGTTWAWIGYDEAGEELWRTTYAATPGEANVYQEYRTCEEGKVINEATGNCVKVTEVVEKTCAEGQYLNPLTGRCKKIETTSSSGTTECKEGYYYYEATGRCRKIVENNGANYSLEAESYEESSSFVALYAVIGVAAVGLVYVIYEFRHEIQKLWLRVCR